METLCTASGRCCTSPRPLSPVKMDVTGLSFPKDKHPQSEMCTIITVCLLCCYSAQLVLHLISWNFRLCRPLLLPCDHAELQPREIRRSNSFLLPVSRDYCLFIFARVTWHVSISWRWLGLLETLSISAYFSLGHFAKLDLWVPVYS